MGNQQQIERQKKGLVAIKLSGLFFSLLEKQRQQ